MRRSAVLPVFGVYIAFLALPASAADVLSLLMKRASRYEAEQQSQLPPLEVHRVESHERFPVPHPVAKAEASERANTKKHELSFGEIDYRLNLRRFEAKYLYGTTAIKARFKYDGQSELEFRWPYAVDNGDLKFSIAEDDGKAALQLVFQLAF